MFSELPKTTQPLHIPFLGSYAVYHPAQDSWLLSRLPVGLIFVKCSTRQHRETLRHVVSLSRGSRLLRDSPTRSISPSDWGERLPPRGVFLPQTFLLPTLCNHPNPRKVHFRTIFILTIHTKQAAKPPSSAALSF